MISYYVPEIKGISEGTKPSIITERCPRDLKAKIKVNPFKNTYCFDTPNLKYCPSLKSQILVEFQARNFTILIRLDHVTQLALLLLVCSLRRSDMLGNDHLTIIRIYHQEVS